MFEKSFIEAYLAGEVNLDNLDDYIQHWHTNDTGNELREFLGMTSEEYTEWLKFGNGLSLRKILAARANEKENAVKYVVVTGNDEYDGIGVSDPFDTAEAARSYLKEEALRLADSLGVDVLSHDFLWTKNDFVIRANGIGYVGGIIRGDIAKEE